MANLTNLSTISEQMTRLVGTPASIVAHTVFFIGIFALEFFGVSFDSILLILTTVVSLEAIYLAIFIQMTVNKQATQIAQVEHNIDEIQEDVEGIESEVEEISEDIEDIQEEETSQASEDAEANKSLDNIEDQLQKIIKELDYLKKKVK